MIIYFDSIRLSLVNIDHCDCHCVPFFDNSYFIAWVECVALNTHHALFIHNNSLYHGSASFTYL